MLYQGHEHSRENLKIVPYSAAHLMALNEQDTENYWGESVKQPGYARMLEKAGIAYSAVRGSHVLACGGIIEQWSGRAICWAIMDRHIGKDMIFVHRAVVHGLKFIRYRRIEATVAEGYENGIRWLEMLGFNRETPMPMQGFAPNGGAHYLYARVRDA